jgi:DNA polymerase-3 subunit beta
MFTIEGDKLTIYATDLNTNFSSTIKLKTTSKEKKSFVTDPKKLAEFLALLAPGDIVLIVEEKKITIQKEKNQGFFNIMESGDFPLPPKLIEKPIVLKAEQFKKTLPLVLFAASRDEARPALSGVNFVSSDGELVTVATDGFRLSLLKEKNTQKVPSMLVPRVFFEEVLSGLKEEDEINFTTSEKEKMVKFSTPTKEYYSRVIEGAFPPFEKVIPTEKKQTIITDREELLRNIKIASLFAREQSNIIILNSDENTSTQDAEIEGDAIQVAFNARFLLDFLQNVSGKKITIELLRSDAPTVFKTDNQKNFIHIIMPVRIQS